MTVPAPPPSLSFSFLGDWGYSGYNQSLVAQSMAVWSMKNNASFVIALGDNFYSKCIVFPYS